MTTLAGLPWLGGKSTAGPVSIGRWVVSLLPLVEPRQMYVEPFAGMLGVLLAREPARVEVANDLDSRVYRFWRALRDEADEVETRLAATPYSREAWQEARQVLAHLDSHSDVEVCCALVVVCHQAYNTQGGWRVQDFRRYATSWVSGSLRLTCQSMRDRLREVQLEHTDAVEVVRQWSHLPEVVMYLDPPYSGVSSYYQADLDWQDLLDACDGAQARIAISDYATSPAANLEGWHCHTYDTTTAASSASDASSARTECLWTNYEVPQQRLAV